MSIRSIRFRLFLCLFIGSISAPVFGQFVTTWKTDNAGTSTNDQITIPTTGVGYLYDIYWEEVGNPTNFGTEPLGLTGNHTITFPAAGTYRVEITGTFPRIYFNGGGDRLKILTVEQWGTNAWTSMANAFLGCENLITDGFDEPDLTVVTDLSSMFQGALMFDDIVSNWDVSNVTNMQNMFFGCDLFNQNLNWDVSNVVNMSGMFGETDNFNGDITNWNVSSVTDFSFMFISALAFNQSLNNWLINTTPGANVNMRAMFQFTSVFNQDFNNWQMDEVTNTSSMFRETTLFNGNIENWNVSKVADMSSMFLNAQVFNRDLNAWDVSAVTTMQSMFGGTLAYSRDLTGWNTRLGNVQDMDMMFAGATAFNGDVSGWIVTSVQSMQGTFSGTTGFNQDLASWDVSNVSDMRNTFNNAAAFNQSLASWSIPSVTAMDNMLSNSNMSAPNYDATLIGWESSGLAPAGISLGAFNVNFCTAGAAKAALAVLGWTITDAGLNCAAAPNAPSDLFTSDVSSTKINLAWSDNSSDETGFIIERREPGNLNFSTIGTSAANVNSFTDTVAAPERGYFYKVIASGVTEDSGPSNEKFGSTITPSGHALATDGNDFVRITDDADFQFGSGDFTIEAWIYYDGTDKAAAIVGKRNPAPPFEQIQLRIGTGLNQPAGKQVEAYIMPDTRAFGPTESPEDRIVTDPTDLTIGWHHVAMVEDYDTDLRLYVDGVLVGTDTDNHLGKPMNAAGQDLYIGSFGGGAHFIGIIDEVRVWRTARSITDIQNNLSTTLVGNEPNLVAYYRMDQGIPNGDNTSPPVTLVPDRSVNNHNGTATNFALDGSTSNWVRSASIARPFITTWQTDNPGQSADDQIKISTYSGTYNYDIYWEEVGNPTNNGTEPTQTGEYVFTVPNPGTYRVEITGLFPGIRFSNLGDDDGKILSVEQWGSNPWTSFEYAFLDCENLQINAIDAPDLSGVTSLRGMFRRCDIVNADLSHWDVSTIVDMAEMFRDAYAFNQPLTSWDVSNVLDMSYMFFFARSFNQDITGWDVSNVDLMGDMFGGATDFNQDISGWTMDNVSDLGGMFAGASSFNQDISGWNTGNVTVMLSLFSSASAFNQDIGGWDISGVTDMRNLFRDATSFNGDISGWDVSGVLRMDEMFSGTNAFATDITGWTVSSVQTMRDMFRDNITFNQNISGWPVSNVNDMNSMFEGATAFNQPIGAWVTTNLNDTRNMFDGATAFDQNLGGWDLNTANLMVNMFRNSGMSVGNYDLTLIGWEAQPLQNNVSFGAQNVFYCSASAERANIIANFGWNITDGGAACINVYNGATLSDPQIEDGQVEPIDMGSTAFGGTRTQTFTIENNLAVDLTALNIFITGGAFTPIVVPPTITIGSSSVFTIELGGPVGAYAETVSISSAEFTDPFEFSLTGEVTSFPEPEIAVYEGDDITDPPIFDGQAPAIEFGYHERGMDRTELFTLENKGSAPLTISDITFTGTKFSTSAVFPIVIPVDGTGTIVITLDGSTAGSFLESVEIINDDTDESIFNFGVFGVIEGPEIRVFDGPDRFFPNPQVDNGQLIPIDFGAAAPGPNIVRQITIGNWGPVDLLISNISITGSAFSISASPPITVDAEFDGIITPVTYDITLSGATAGLFAETITLTTDDDDDLIFTFDLVGTIEGPSSAPHIYWTENIGDALGGDDEIHRTDLDGNEFHRYYQGFSAEIAGLEMDTANNRMYWTDAARAEIIYGEIGPNGLTSGPTVILDFNPGNTSDMEDLALDEPNGHLYFTHGNAETGFANKIARVDIDGSNYVELIDLSFEEPFGIDLDLANGKIYYTTNLTATDQDSRLYRANLDGTGVEQLFYLSTSVSSGVFFRDVKIDPVNEIVYWSAGEEDVPGGVIYYNDLNEAASFSSPTSFSFPGEPRGIDIDLFNNKLYWVCRGANDGATRPMIMRSNLDGSTIENIFTMALYPQNYPPGPPGSAHLALDLRGLAIATAPEINVFVGPDNTGTVLTAGQSSIENIGSTLVGTDLIQSFTIENTGTADLVISGSTVNGPAFSISGADGTIAAGASQTFDVILSGAVAGSFTDAVSLTTNDSDELTFSFPITGDVLVASTGEINLFAGNDNTGTAISDGQTSSIDFGSATIGTDIERTFAIENTGLSELIITGITFSDPAYTLVGAAPTSIAVGETAVFTVQLSGVAAGTFTGTLSIANSDPDEDPFDFMLTGTILPVAVPEIALFVGNGNGGQELLNDQAFTVTLGAGPVGTDLTQLITIENIGAADLVISGFTSSAAVFTIDESFPLTIAAGGVQPLTLRLDGGSVGTFATDLTLVSNDADEASFIVPVSGVLQGAEIVIYAGNTNTGTPITNDVSQVIDLGSEEKDNTFIFTFSVENTGNIDLTIASITSDNPVLTISTFPSSVAAGEFLVFDVVINTSIPGTYLGVITIVSDLGSFIFTAQAEVTLPFEIFNAVSPNGDGVHDFLNLQGIEEYPNNTVYIYSKLGSLVYEQSGYDNTQSSSRFEGIGNKSNYNELASGTYYYVLDLGEGNETKSGYIVLNR